METEFGPLGELRCELQGISEAGAEEFYIQLEPRLSYEPGDLTNTTPFPRRHRFVLRRGEVALLLQQDPRTPGTVLAVTLAWSKIDLGS